LDLRDPSFLPGGAKYGDVPGMLALHAPHALWLTGETPAGTEFVRRQYRHAANRLTEYRGEPGQEENAAVKWLLDAGGR